MLNTSVRRLKLKPLKGLMNLLLIKSRDYSNKRENKDNKLQGKCFLGNQKINVARYCPLEFCRLPVFRLINGFKINSFDYYYKNNRCQIGIEKNKNSKI